MIESFSETYEEARRKFVAAATQPGGAPELKRADSVSAPPRRDRLKT